MNTEFTKRKSLIKQGGQELISTKTGGENLNLESSTNAYLCDTVEEFKKLESEIGVAARWTIPRKPNSSPQWESRWRWKPEDGQGWPRHGTDVY